MATTSDLASIPRPLTAAELDRLVAGLLQPTALIEAAVLLGCLFAAWLLVRLLRGREIRLGSTWFGDRIVDGAMFPLLALLLVLLVRWLLRHELPAAVFGLAVPILLSLALIRLVVRVLRTTFPHSALMRVVERSVSWLAWLAVVLWVTGVLPLLVQELDAISWKMGSSRISMRNLLEGAVNVIVVLVVALWVSSLLEARLLKDASDNLSVRKIAANAVRALLLLLGLMFALSAAGIDLTALSVLGGALGVGIGFGLQKLASNYISGFVILAERSVRIGDMVKVDSFEGRISDITTRYTVIRALNGRESIVPNEMLITQRVENLSLADPRVSVSTTVQVAFGTDLNSLLPRLVAGVGAVPRVLVHPGPGVSLSNFVADGLELSIGFWIEDPHNGQGNVRSDVNLAILRVLEEEGVETPVAQRLVKHVNAPPGADLTAPPADS